MRSRPLQIFETARWFFFRGGEWIKIRENLLSCAKEAHKNQRIFLKKPNKNSMKYIYKKTINIRYVCRYEWLTVEPLTCGEI